MGKLLNYMLILVMIDVLFLVTGQLGLNSPTSVIIGAIQNLSDIKGTTLFIAILGIAGIAALASTAGVKSGLFSSAIQATLFIPMALGLAAMIGDFVTVFNKLADFNFVLATVVMSPIMVIFIFVVAEWVRGKDN